MANYLPGTGPAEAATLLPPAPRTEISKGRLIMSGVLSSLIPGTGHFVVGRWQRGIVPLLAYATLVSSYLLLRFPRSLAGIIVPVLALIALSMYAVCDAAYSSKAAHAKPNQWWLAAFLPMALIAGIVDSQWMVLASGFQSFLVSSMSMEPAIPEGSQLVVDRRYYRHRMPQRGDIVAVESPAEQGIYVVKRVIAVGGDKIEVRGDAVFVNDARLSEPYVQAHGELPDVLERVRPITLPPGKLFIMGDNRHVSFDSRVPKFGLVDMSLVLGKVIWGFMRRKGEVKTYN